MPPLRSEFLKVAFAVLTKVQRPMSPREIVDYALEHGMFTGGVIGKTKHQTMKAKLSVHVRRYGTKSPFMRTRPGRFFVRDLYTGSEYAASPLRPPAPRERVLAFRATLFGATERPQGIQRNSRAALRAIADSSPLYLDRLVAEQDDTFKQVLTYILVTRGHYVLAFRRGTYNRAEDFLKGSRCIGFGGHVTEADVDLFARKDFGIYRAAARELAEELRLPVDDAFDLVSGKRLRLAGVLNDDSSVVGRRHFAFVFRYDAPRDERWDKPERNEKSITQLEWLDLSSAQIRISDFEYWSELCLREFFPNAISAIADFHIIRRRLLRRPHVLCVTGPIGSGKSEATRVLRGDFGYTEINSGDALAELLNIAGVKQLGRSKFQDAATALIEAPEGPPRFAEHLAQKVRLAATSRVLIDGIRHHATLQSLRAAVDVPVFVLYVHTPAHVAFRLYQRREEPNISMLDYFRLRESPAEGEARRFIRFADAVLYNASGRLEFRVAIRNLMSQLGLTASTDET